MTTDKTGAPTTVTTEADRFTIAVDGQPVGLAEFETATVNESSSTPKSPTASKVAVWQRFSSPKRFRRPATPDCGLLPSARWWPATSASTMSSTTSSTRCHPISSAG